MDAAWVPPVIASIATLVFNTVVVFVVNYYLKRYFTRKEKLEAEREEKAKKERARLMELEAKEKSKQLTQMMDDRCNAQVSVIRAEFKPVIDHLKVIENGTLSSLRDDLLNNFYRCRDYQKYRTEWDTQNMEDLYASYTHLNGNSFIQHMMTEFYKIPLQERSTL